MNKKVLLSSLLASGIVATSLLTGNVKAATNVPNYGKQLMSAVDKVSQAEPAQDEFILGVLLPNSNVYGKKDNVFTKGKLEDLLNAKYKKNIVKKVLKADGVTEVTKYEDNVGTGYIVELETGRTMKVVLYGDVTKDGMVDTDDTLAIAKQNVKQLTLDADQKLAAHLTVKEADAPEIDTGDSVRVAFYNVNTVGSDKTGEAILDMALYPEDYTETEETVVSDDVLQDAIDELAEVEGNSDLFEITLDGTTNTAEFGLKDESKTISEFVGTKLIDKLVDQLKNNPNLAKIELVCDGLEAPIELNKEDNEITCMSKAKDLICKVLGKEATEVEDVLKTKVSELFGKKFQAKFYVEDTSKLDDEAVEGEDVIQGTYVEYTLEFVGKINVDETVMKALDVVEGTIGGSGDQVFDVKIDTETNKGIVGFLKNDTTIANFTKTNLMVAANSVFTNANVTKIAFSISNASGKSATDVMTKEAVKTDYTNDIKSKIMELLKNVLGDSGDISSKTVKDLAGITFTMKIYLGENTEAYDTDVLEENGVKYVQYVLDVVVDGNGEIQKDIFDVLNKHAGNEIYRISFDEENDHQVNVSFKTADKEKSLADIYGTGSTGLIVMAKQLMTKLDAIKNAVNNITVNYNGQNYVIRTETGEEYSLDVARKLFNDIFGTQLELSDITSLVGNPSTENIKSKLTEAKLGDLENAQLSITIGLKDSVVQETNWEAVEKYDFNFIFADKLPGAEE